MLRIAVCDDEKEYLDQLVFLLNQWSEETGHPVEIQRFEDGDHLLSSSHRVKYDLIFLDIVMPLLNGMDTARELRIFDKSVRIIFLTSSPEFALASYDVHAYHYLIKPATYPKIRELMDDCATQLEKDEPSLLLKTGHGFQKVYYKDISYIEALNKKVLFHLIDGRHLDVVDTFKSVEERFAGNELFFKIHRSYIVYLPNIDHFDNSTVYTVCGAAIPIARGMGKSLQNAYFHVMFQSES